MGVGSRDGCKGLEMRRVEGSLWEVMGFWDEFKGKAKRRAEPWGSWG